MALPFDRRVRFLRALTTENDHGELEAAQWSRLADTFARIRPAAGRERFASAEQAAEAMTVFEVRWSEDLADLAARDRLEMPPGGALFDIHSVQPIGRNRELEVTATRRGD